MDVVRLPPQSIEAEQAVLGGLLINNAAWDRIADVIQESHFYRADHRLIFKHIWLLIESNKPADVLTVVESLGDEVSDAGGQTYIASIALNFPSAANIRQYAEILSDRAQKRAIISACSEASDAAYSAPGEPAGALVEAIDAKLFAMREKRSGSRLMSAVLTGVIEEIDTLYARPDKSAVTGLPTGFVDLDRMTSGLQPGDLIVIAGRPSMGKTAAAMNIVEYAALNEKKAAAVFSLEMSDRQLTQRMIGSVGRLNQHELRTGMFRESDWPRIVETVGKLSDARIIIEETYDLSPSTLRAKSRRLKREYPDLGLIVVDYLQLMEGASERRVDQIAEISRALKRIALELNIPVVALSQLNRSLENRPNKRPQMSDLRDSGAIEQDADLILFLYRDEVYDPESQARGTAELIIGKHRNGPTGMVRLTFSPAFTRFDNYAGGPIHYTPKPTGHVFDFKKARAGLD